MSSHYKIDEETQLYYTNGQKFLRSLWELITNSDRIINGVYIFENFNEYCRQLSSDRQEDKKEVYWRASYYEKLIDYIKIVVAFETLNKAILVKKGYLIHKIDHLHNKQLRKKQNNGNPITLEEFYIDNYTNIDVRRRTATLNGLTKNLSTINFSHTLNDEYQKILQQEKTLVRYLKEINNKRNRLHLYSDFKGAFSVSHHIQKWKTIRELCLNTIKNEADQIDLELKNSYNEKGIY